MTKRREIWEKIRDYENIVVYEKEIAAYEAGEKLPPERAEKVSRYLAGKKALQELRNSCIKFNLSEKEKYREMLSRGEFSIFIFWDSPVLTGANISFSCYPGEVFLRSVYEHGPFSSLEEAEDYIFQVEKNELDSWYEEGGETCFWHYSPSGKECPPPDFSKYGYRAVEGPSDYWWIEPI